MVDWENFLAELRRSDICDLSDRSEHGIEFDDVHPNQVKELLELMEQNPNELSGWVLLGSKFLSLIPPSNQKRIYNAILRLPRLYEVSFGPRQSDHPQKALDTDRVPSQPILEALLESDTPIQENMHLNMARITGDVEIELLARPWQNWYPAWLVLSKGVSAGFLDPLVTALARGRSLHGVTICVKPPAKESQCLVSPSALRVLLRGHITYRIDLDGIGLDDRHCEIIREEAGGKSYDLNLRSNPRIGSSGYEAIVRAVSCDYSPYQNHGPRITVDDAYWAKRAQITFDMDRQGRHKYVEQGAFKSKTKWCDWLIEITGIRMPWMGEDEFEFVDRTQTEYIFHALLERPDFVVTVEADSSRCVPAIRSNGTSRKDDGVTRKVAVLEGEEEENVTNQHERQEREGRTTPSFSTMSFMAAILVVMIAFFWNSLSNGGSDGIP